MLSMVESVMFTVCRADRCLEKFRSKFNFRKTSTGQVNVVASAVEYNTEFC
jgi:hypothetical protein